MLEREYQYYQSHKEELKAQYPKRYLVLVGEQVVGNYDDHTEALRETLKTHKIGTFLIHDTTDQVVVFHSRIYA